MNWKKVCTLRVLAWNHPFNKGNVKDMQNNTTLLIQCLQRKYRIFVSSSLWHLHLKFGLMSVAFATYKTHMTKFTYLITAYLVSVCTLFCSCRTSVLERHDCPDDQCKIKIKKRRKTQYNMRQIRLFD